MLIMNLHSKIQITKIYSKDGKLIAGAGTAIKTKKKPSVKTEAKNETLKNRKL